jgi:hypothetical protein
VAFFMRKIVLLAAALSISAPLIAAPAGSAQNFLDRANRLKGKGPLALFDADYKRLKAEGTAAGRSIGADRSPPRKRADRSSIAHPRPVPNSARWN